MALRITVEGTDLDQCAWPLSLQLECYGARLGIRVSRPCFGDDLLRRLPPGATIGGQSAVDELYSILISDPSAHDLHGVYRNRRLLVQSENIDEILTTFESDVHFRVALHARGVLFVHAGVVGWKGRAIVMPGRSYSGKSTLVDALVCAGATYFSDEYAAFDASGEIHPYSKPLMLRGEKGQTRTHYPANTGERPTPGDHLPLGTIVITTYRPATAWYPRRVSGARGLLALLDNTVLARRRSDIALPTLARAARGAVVLESMRGDAVVTATQILDQHDRGVVASNSEKED